MNEQSIYVVYSSAKAIASLLDSLSRINAVRNPRHARSLRVGATVGEEIFRRQKLAWTS
jgi:hypothetical protein